MKLERNLSSLDYENKSTNFLIKQKQFEYQYAPLYAERLVSMKKELSKACAHKWPQYEVKSLVDLIKHDKCVIMGTIYKEMKNKPNILKELAEDDESSALPIQPINRDAKYIDLENDQLILEDDLQRILLIDATNSNLIKSNTLCTGLVIALLGTENENSEFEIEDYVFKETPIYDSLITPKETPSKSDKHIVFLSGLELGDGSKTNEYLFKLQLLIDYLRGDFISEASDDLSMMLSNTIRLIIAGNSLSSSTQSKDMINKAKYLTKNYVAGSVGAIRQLDDFLLQLINKLEVDIMPGEYDPSNLMLPQQPLHHAMLTKSISSDFKYNLHTTTNPYKFNLNGLSFMGTSGQFIDDIRKSTNVDDPIEIMKLTLQAGHIGPTCPDTLACYPFYGKDPFILDELPNIYFCGNQNEFKHEVYTPEYAQHKQIHLISLPKFSTSYSCIFLNLSTLKSEQINF
ncbi:unnamed protein product [Brachionus calyciflorus]|uniref:DNA polymerase delta subunit 2 n=1 Tax=Brachionus calyciflorus TaxID=104777 RepID=A0A814QJ64_9BILA|nr:unnamed protein product [Brachionus calyciflorus]